MKSNKFRKAFYFNSKGERLPGVRPGSSECLATFNFLKLARIISIDYGSKRTGIAVTDPLQIIASGLETVHTAELIEYLTNYFQTEEVEKMIVGMPTHLDGNPTKITPLVVGFINKMKKLFPDLEIIPVDEHFTSVQAKEIIRQSGAKKKKRQEKGLVDKISAVLILQEYMENNR